MATAMESNYHNASQIDQQIQYIAHYKSAYERQGSKAIVPHPGPQYSFLSSMADEALYGGAAGGGKTFALMAFPLRFVDQPGFRALLLRRTFPELERSIIARSRDMYGSLKQYKPKYSEQRKAWTFASGAVIEFGYLDRDADVSKYQSAEYQYIGFDELTHFTEYQFDYMRSRLRSGQLKMNCYLRAGTNPGGVGHVWVKRRFIDTCPPGEVRYFARVYGEDGEQTEIEIPLDKLDQYISFSRQFFPAKVSDNLTIMENDPGYINRLENMPDLQRRMLLLGDWNVYEGQMFGKWREQVHVVHSNQKPGPETYKFVSIDYGTSAPMCALWHSVDYAGNDYVYRELYGAGMTATQQAIKIKELSARDGKIKMFIADPSMWIKNQATLTTMRSIADLYSDEGVLLTQANNDRVHGWNTVREYIDWKGTESAIIQRPKLTVHVSCRHLRRTLPAMISSLRDPEDSDDKCEDHAPDSLRYGLMHVSSPNRKQRQQMDPGYGDHGAVTTKRDANYYQDKGVQYS